MNYYIGIDGGGTKTKLCLINENERVISEITSGPSSIDSVSINITTENILVPIKSIFDILPSNSVIAGIFAGIGGIVTMDDEKKVENIIRSFPQISNETKVMVKNDMFNALYSGKLFEEGAALIVGTGTVAFGKNKDRFHKCSGWGYKEGDAGSSFDLGLQALRLLIRVIDGRLPATCFTNELKDAIKINNINDIVPTVNKLYEDRITVASYAKIVTKHANLNDQYARKIVQKATDELALSVKGVYDNINITNKTLVIVGSLGNSEGYFKNLLHKKIKRINKDIKIIDPIVDPAYGAALMAKYIV